MKKAIIFTKSESLKLYIKALLYRIFGGFYNE